MNESENKSVNGEPNNFGLPDGYFQNSAVRLMNQMEWLEEHKEWKHLSALKKTEAGFIVPSQYFEISAGKTELMEYPVLSATGKKHGFQVPPSYFEDSEAREFEKVMVEEERDLLFLSKENNFQTTPRYFETNEERLKALLNEPASTQGRVISLLSWRSVAVSAAALLLIALGIRTYNLYIEQPEEKDCGTIACIDRVELLKTKTLENLETDELYELVNPEKLKKTLSKEKTAGKGQKDSSLELNDEMIDDLIDDI